MMVGIDEVGRGCWAGPLVAGAVLLNGELEGLRDSKQLTRARRDALETKIYDSAEAIGLGWVTAQEIDEIGMTASVALAMGRALKQITIDYDEVIIDGNYNYLPHVASARAVVKADGSIPAVSAASIIAKVARDRYMANLPKNYAQYGFEKHVGYGTAAHMKALQEFGVSDLHRRSFKPVRALLQ